MITKCFFVIYGLFLVAILPHIQTKQSYPSTQHKLHPVLWCKHTYAQSIGKKLFVQSVHTTRLRHQHPHHRTQACPAMKRRGEVAPGIASCAYTHFCPAFTLLCKGRGFKTLIPQGIWLDKQKLLTMLQFFHPDKETENSRSFDSATKFKIWHILYLLFTSCHETENLRQHSNYLSTYFLNFLLIISWGKQ